LLLLERTAEAAETSAAELREVRAEHPDAASMLGPDGLGQIAAEFGLRQSEAVCEWARWASDRLRAESAEP
jgi:PadR family transcriptional regulator AphA